MRLENSRQAKAYHQARKQAMAEAGRHWADTDMQIRLRFAWGTPATPSRQGSGW